MNKATLLLSVGLLIAVASRSQEFYGRFGLGYAFANAGQTTDGSATPFGGSVRYNTYSNAYTIKNTSFSTGVVADLAFGYMFDKHIGVEVGFQSTFIPAKTTFNLYNYNNGGVLSNITIEQKPSNPLMFIPSLVLQSGGDVLNAYTRFGLVLPMRTMITQDQIITNLPGTGAITTDDFTSEIKSSFSLGFAAAAGLKYKKSSRVSLWGEIGFVSLSVLAKEAKLVAASENGQSIDLNYVSGNHTVTYSKSAVVDSVGAQQPTYSLPFSNMSVKFGVTYTLSAHESKAAQKTKPRGGRFR